MAQDRCQKKKKNKKKKPCHYNNEQRILHLTYH
jgi:hypothetical protein